MHELGLIIDVVEKVDRIAEEQNLKKIDKVVLQVGEAFSVVPQMMLPTICIKCIKICLRCS